MSSAPAVRLVTAPWEASLPGDLVERGGGLPHLDPPLRFLRGRRQLTRAEKNGWTYNAAAPGGDVMRLRVHPVREPLQRERTSGPSRAAASEVVPPQGSLRWLPG